MGAWGRCILFFLCVFFYLVKLTRSVVEAQHVKGSTNLRISPACGTASLQDIGVQGPSFPQLCCDMLEPCRHRYCTVHGYRFATLHIIRNLFVRGLRDRNLCIQRSEPAGNFQYSKCTFKRQINLVVRGVSLTKSRTHSGLPSIGAASPVSRGLGSALAIKVIKQFGFKQTVL